MSKEGAVTEVGLDSEYVKDAVRVARELNNVIVIKKSADEVITNGRRTFIVTQPSSLKRCGGIGDILSGLTSLYTYWAYCSFYKGIIQLYPSSYNFTDKNLEMKDNTNLLWGCILASLVTRKASFEAFQQKKLSLCVPDIFNSIGHSLEWFI